MNFGLLGRVRLGFHLFRRFVRFLSQPLNRACFLWVFSFCTLTYRGKPVEESKSGRTGGGFNSPTVVVAGVLPVGYLPPPGNDKGKISEIRYPCGSKYLRAAVRYADVVGHNRVEPSYAKTFATRYGPPSDV